MSRATWATRVGDAALEIADSVPELDFGLTVPDRIGHILVLLGRAAGHTGQIGGSTPNAQLARVHFRSELRQAAALAVETLRDSSRREGRPPLTSNQISGDIAQRRVLPAHEGEREEGPPVARHATAGLGAAIVAIAHAVRTIPLDDAHLPELDGVLEDVIAHAILAMALLSDAPSG